MGGLERKVETLDWYYTSGKSAHKMSVPRAELESVFEWDLEEDQKPFLLFPTPIEGYTAVKPSIQGRHRKVILALKNPTRSEKYKALGPLPKPIKTYPTLAHALSDLNPPGIEEHIKFIEHAKDCILKAETELGIGEIYFMGGASCAARLGKYNGEDALGRILAESSKGLRYSIEHFDHENPQEYAKVVNRGFSSISLRGILNSAKRAREIRLLITALLLDRRFAITIQNKSGPIGVLCFNNSEFKGGVLLGEQRFIGSEALRGALELYGKKGTEYKLHLNHPREFDTYCNRMNYDLSPSKALSEYLVEIAKSTSDPSRLQNLLTAKYQ